MVDKLERSIIENFNTENEISIKFKKQDRKITLDPNLYFDKIFIINLPRSRDRWNKIKMNLIQLGIYNFERQNGVYLPRNSLSELPGHFYQRLEAYGGKFRENSSYILNAVGVNMAHFEIIKKAIKRNYDRILILEDDTFLVKDFWKKFIRGVSYLETQNWDMIYLGWKKSRPHPQLSRISSDLIIPFGGIRGAYGYALHKRMFRYLVKNHLFRGMELDAFYEFMALKHRNVFAFSPTIIGHRDKLVSTITDTNWKNR